MKHSSLKRPEPWLDVEMSNRPGEEWRDVVNYDGIYEVSNHGRIKSIARYTTAGRLVTGRIRKQDQGHAAQLALSCDGVVWQTAVMPLVADAFLPARPEGHHWYHKNKNALDNRLSNIAHGTHSVSQSVAYAVGAMDPVRADNTTQGDYMKQDKRKHETIYGVFANGSLVGKVCTACLMEHPATEFTRAGTDDSTNRICRTCKLIRQGIKDVGKNYHRAELAHAGLRICSKCKQTKALDNDFCKDKNRSLGRSNQCRACGQAANVLYNAAAKARKK